MIRTALIAAASAIIFTGCATGPCDYECQARQARIYGATQAFIATQQAQPSPIDTYSAFQRAQQARQSSTTNCVRTYSGMQCVTQ
jgi:hypothetical protein